jgi:CO/xanthine dehydrogenase FAD-binding subunit
VSIFWYAPEVGYYVKRHWEPKESGDRYFLQTVPDSELRLAVGAVSPRAERIAAGEETAREMYLTDQMINLIACEAARIVDPIDDLRGSADYKRHLVEVLTRRALAALVSGSLESNA